MADPFAIIAIINTHRADLEAALGPDGPAFFSRLDDLFTRALAVAADMNAQASVGDELLALVDQYPGARAVLRAADPATFGPLTPGDAAPAPPATPEPGPPTGHAGLRPPSPVETAEGNAGAPPDGATGESPASTTGPAATDTSGAPAPDDAAGPATPDTPSGGGPATITLAPSAAGGPILAAEPALSDNAPSSAPIAGPPGPPGPTGPPGPPGPPGTAVPPTQAPADDITLAERLQLRKETVATVLALLVVGGTVGLALIAVLFIRGSDLSTAKDVLVLLSSLAGVVLGYYFGRIPGDAHAEQSAQQAQQAQEAAAHTRSAAQSVGERALEMANQVSRIREAVLLQNTPGATRDIGAGAVPPADAIRQLQELQTDLENLARQARQV